MEDTIDDVAIPIGEELLTKEFMLIGPEAMKQSYIIHEALEESRLLNQTTTGKDRSSNGDGPLNRPMTPSMLNKKMQTNNFAPEMVSRPKLPRTPLSQSDIQQNISNISNSVINQPTPISNDIVRQSFNQMYKQHNADDFIQNQNLFDIKGNKDIQNLKVYLA